jgi:hypothetical protein
MRIAQRLSHPVHKGIRCRRSKLLMLKVISILTEAGRGEACAHAHSASDRSSLSLPCCTSDQVNGTGGRRLKLRESEQLRGRCFLLRLNAAPAAGMSSAAHLQAGAETGINKDA